VRFRKISLRAPKVGKGLEPALLRHLA